jgi:coenzyme F420-reducing hydrogenase delta subunit
MAEYGEWNRKGATLSEVTAKKEYGVDRDFIIKGIETGKLEYRHGSIWGNPYIKVLRRQLEEFIRAELGPDYLVKVTGKTELRRIKKEISELEQKLSELQAKKAELEKIMNK